MLPAANITSKQLTSYGIAQLQKLSTAENVGLEVDLLLMQVLAVDRVKLKAYPEKIIAPLQVVEFTKALARRLAGEPIAYILGKKEFWNFTVIVNQDVLIPRPETELLVQIALEKLEQGSLAADNIKILDLATGSGVVAIALALECPTASVLATDASAAALEIAKLNIARQQLHNVACMHGDLFTPVAACREKFDLIASNPPYIAADDPHLQDLQYEPAAALVAGADGLALLKRIIAAAQDFLVANGWLLVEHGYDQAQPVQQLFAYHNYGNISSYKDLNGHLRVTCGRNINFN